MADFGPTDGWIVEFWNGGQGETKTEKVVAWDKETGEPLVRVNQTQVLKKAGDYGNFRELRFEGDGDHSLVMPSGWVSTSGRPAFHPIKDSAFIGPIRTFPDAPPVLPDQDS